MRIDVIGSGIVGLCCAREFASRGCEVTLIAASNGPDEDCCSWWAGGMLAPYCEQESAEPLIGELGAEGMAFWRDFRIGPVMNGTLVVAASRDAADLKRFSNRTERWRWMNGQEIGAIEPDLEGRFSRALFFADEGHFDARKVLEALLDDLRGMGVTLRLDETVSADDLASDPEADWRIDCRGLAARDALPDLRGVKGEMLLLQTSDISLSRPVRLLHPRYPLYIVPREGGRFMVGATQIESSERGRPTARSILELLSAAYALHPAFGEAELLQIGSDARPAFPDNLPKIRKHGRTIHVNGMYRHGFLASPAMARRAADVALKGEYFQEVMDEDRRQRQLA